MRSERLFVLTRRDFLPGFAAVQTAHSVAELVSTRRPDFKGEIPYVIVLGVKDEAELDSWRTRMDGKADFVAFREPDLGNQLTAIAYWGKKFPGFGGLRLL